MSIPSRLYNDRAIFLNTPRRLTFRPARPLPAAFFTTSTYLEGYIQNTSDNVNHGITLDGKLAVWVVKVTSNGTVGATSAA